MARSRLEFHAMLEEKSGISNVYYQPPATIAIQYPCLIYVKSKDQIDFANNIHYLDRELYKVTAIYKDADSTLPDTISKIPFSRFDMYYTAENLHHDVYNIYF